MTRGVELEFSVTKSLKYASHSCSSIG